ncbi:MAG TPA: DUF1501 domain-containing protein [Steroidobacteraceae bacterium]|jgi:uncharacterized protein (DUF1501 family)|nr:DUF1501 domain-containing protein [Steroidobacteraceae bacterium]
MNRDHHAPINRRSLLKLGLAAGTAALTARYSFAAPAATPSRFVFIILRGALDGMSAVPPYADPDYARLRGELAIAAPGGSDGALALDGYFGLNPGLTFMHEAYGARELLVLPAVATAYRERSHFDGQDVLESGITQPHATQTGWLNRALINLPSATRRGRESGVALAQNVPLVLRGSAEVASWSPSVLPDLDDDTMRRIADRYASDPLLARRLAEALATGSEAGQAQAQPDTMNGDASGAPAMNALVRSTAGRYTETVRTAAGFLRRDDGPAVAVFDTTGWDTHFNEGGAQGQLRTRLAVLDQSLRTLKETLGDVWPRTVVLLATEFGRTAAANGTRGTDHGTGSAAFLLGGAVAGGRVLADWPGLSARNLYQQRDLKPTLDVRSVMKSVLHEHLQIASGALDRDVFPDSSAAPYIAGLLRAHEA